MNCFRKIYHNSFFKFAFVGILNTLIGTFVMFLCYHLGCGYWLSSAMNYIVGSIFSYFANKYFTFRSNNQSKNEIVKFVLNISICYLIAYGCAKPLVKTILSFFLELDKTALEKIAMVTGMGLFVFANYLGQRFFVFYNNKASFESHSIFK